MWELWKRELSFWGTIRWKTRRSYFPLQTLVDTHTHTYLCKHAEYIQPRAYLEIAAQQGFTHFAFCDHNPFEEDDYDIIHRMNYKEFELFNRMHT